jgi:anti-sigma B factor antagonist
VSDTPQPPFRIVPGPDARTFVLSGELDMASTDRVADAVGTVDGAGDVVFDLRALAFIDSSGIRALLQVAERLGEGRLILDQPTEPVLRVFDLVVLREASTKVVIRT